MFCFPTLILQLSSKKVTDEKENTVVASRELFHIIPTEFVITFSWKKWPILDQTKTTAQIVYAVKEIKNNNNNN